MPTKILTHPIYSASISHFAFYAQYPSLVCFEMQDTYQKQTLRNRAYIYGANGKQALTIPVKHHKKNHNILYKELLIENTTSWQTQHWKSIVSAYNKSPFFEYYKDDLQPLYDKKYTHLMAFNLEVTQTYCELIGIPFPNRSTNSYEINYDKSQYIDIRKQTQHKKTAPITLDPYIQVFEQKHGFLSDLSILDLLCNEGSNTLSYLHSICLHTALNAI